MSNDSKETWWTKKYQLGEPMDWSGVGDWWNKHGGIAGVVNDYVVKPASTGLGAAFNKADAFFTGSSGTAPAQKGAGTQRPDGGWDMPTTPAPNDAAGNPQVWNYTDKGYVPAPAIVKAKEPLGPLLPGASYTYNEQTNKWDYTPGTLVNSSGAPGRTSATVPLTPEQQMQADIAAEQARIDAEYGKMATDLGSQFVYNEDPAERARKDQALGTISEQGKSAQKAIDDAYKAGIISSQEAAAASQQVRNEQAQYLGSLLTQSGDKIREMNSKVNTHYADQYGSVGAMNPSMGTADDLAALMYRTAPVEAQYASSLGNVTNQQMLNLGDLLKASQMSDQTRLGESLARESGRVSAQYAQQEAARRDDMERAKRQMMLQIEQDKLAAKARLGEKYFDATTGADLRGQAAGREVNAANNTKNSGGLGYVKPANPWSTDVQVFGTDGRSTPFPASFMQASLEDLLNAAASESTVEKKRALYTSQLSEQFGPTIATQIMNTPGYGRYELFPDK